MKRMWKIGLVILIAGIMTLGYGGWCEKDDDDDATGSSGTTPTPSAQVTSPNPTNGATNIPITTPLIWATASGATSYNVYFDTFSPPTTFRANVSGTSYNPGTLSYSETYYWQIDSKNTSGTTTGNVWSFTTQAPPPPAQVTSPNPSSGAANIPITTPLIWATASGAISYDVYFDTFTPPTTKVATTTGTSYNPGTLSYSETYYWQIDSKNTGGTTTGNIWSFQTEAEPIVPPDQVISPDPADGAICVPITQKLGWAAAIGATSYDVYFGTTSPGTFSGNQTSTIYNPSPLTYTTTCYWRIDSRNSDGTTMGNTWNFQTPWTIQLGTVEGDSARGVATDTSGNIYVTGSTMGDLGDANPNAGNSDLFVVKYDTAGVKQWTRQLGTTTNDPARGVATDTSGNIYVAGYTGGDLGDVNPNAGGWDLFVVKYNPAGVKQWTRQLGTVSTDYAFGVAIDTSDNIYVVGYTMGDLGDVNPNAGGSDLFVVKYNTDGVKQWTRQLGTYADDGAYGVATDTSDNIYVVGGTRGYLDGNTNAGNKDIFVVKYDTDGVKQWTKLLGNGSDNGAYGVATDTSDNIYVVGFTSGDLDGNPSAGYMDLFVVKYDSDGVKQWTRQLGTASWDEAHGVATDTSGNIYVVGYTPGGLDGNTSAGGDDLFVVKYNSAGAKQWTRQLGTTAGEWAYGVATDSVSGNIYVVGYTGGGLDGHINAGGSDIFVIKYNSAGVKQ